MRKSMMASVHAALALAARAEASAGRAKTTQTKGLAEQARRLAQGVQALDEMVRAKSPADTMDTHTLKVAQSAKRLQQSVENARQNFSRAYTAGLHDLYEQIHARTGISFDRDSERGQEIRSYFRSLPQEDRFKAFQRALDAHDKETMTAIFNAPDYLTGIPSEHRSAYLKAYQTKMAPELMEEIETLKAADEAAREVANVAWTALDEVVEPGNVRRIMEQQEKAEEIKAAFSQTVMDA